MKEFITKALAYAELAAEAVQIIVPAARKLMALNYSSHDVFIDYDENK